MKNPCSFENNEAFTPPNPPILAKDGCCKDEKELVTCATPEKEYAIPNKVNSRTILLLFFLFRNNKFNWILNLFF